MPSPSRESGPPSRSRRGTSRSCTGNPRPTSTRSAATQAPRLTARHRDLLHLVAAGHTNAQIARRLGISEGTVRTHLENIYRLLKVSSRTGAVTRAFADRTA